MNLPKTQPGTYLWVGACYNPSLHQTKYRHYGICWDISPSPKLSRKLTMYIQYYTKHHTPHTHFSSANKEVMHLVTIQLPALILLALLGGTPNFQYLTDLNQNNPTKQRNNDSKKKIPGFHCCRLMDQIFNCVT